MLNIGHRGACGYEPENTIISFKKALELGVDAIELDVYVCKTGELVVIHDDTVDRTTNGKGYVINMAFDELRALDAGKGEQIPTLQEVLDLINNQVLLNIELKGAGTAEPIAEVIKQYTESGKWTKENFLVSSFNHVELKKFNNMMPDIKIGALLCGIPLDYAKQAEALNAYSFNPSMEFINKELVEDAHSRGMKVFVYTVNELQDIEAMKQLGVDGIFINYPDRLT